MHLRRRNAVGGGGGGGGGGAPPPPPPPPPRRSLRIALAPYSAADFVLPTTLSAAGLRSLSGSA